MYEVYWHLSEKPFEQTADPRFFFAAESHQAALLKLRYATENRRGGALLTGPAGVGKTQVIETLHRTAPDWLRPFIHIVFPHMSAAELLAYVADELIGSRSAETNAHANVQRIAHFLEENTRRGRHAVVAIDEAHLLDSPESLETLRLLMNFQADGRQGLSLVLVGQTALLPLLRRTPQLDDRLAVKCMLRPLTPAETKAYAQHRLSAAGASSDLIAPDAFDALHELSHGLPRQINRLCDLALLIGFADQREQLTADLFEAVAEELVAVVPE